MASAWPCLENKGQMGPAGNTYELWKKLGTLTWELLMEGNQRDPEPERGVWATFFGEVGDSFMGRGRLGW